MAANWTPLDSISVQSVQAATEAAPTLTTDGMSLEAVISFTVWLDCGSGTVLADTGQVDLYRFDNGQWSDAPVAIIQIPPGSTGKSRIPLNEIEVQNRRGRVAPICNGISASVGSITLEVLATIDRRGVAKAV